MVALGVILTCLVQHLPKLMLLCGGGVALLGHSALNFLVVSGVTGFAHPLVSLVVAYAGKLVNRGQSLPSYLVVHIHIYDDLIKGSDVSLILGSELLILEKH